MADQPNQKPPMPRWFWFILGLLIAAFIASLTAALWLPKPAPSTKTKAVAQSRPLLPTVIRLPILPPISPTVTEFPAEPIEAIIEASPTLPVTQPSPTASPTLTPEPFWQRNSKAAEYASVTGPKLAIILDDMGVAPAESAQAVHNLPAAVTFSFLAYGVATSVLARQAFNDGHEIMVHLPMEPLPHKNQKLDPGPDALEVGDAPDFILAKLEHHLGSLDALAVGVNNHMGSRFTAWPEGMRTLLTQLNKQGYLFLDSLTITPTATRQAAQGLTLPVLKRDIFLDHNPTPEDINRQLDHALALARKQGFAIVIGHPLSTTLAVLEERLPTLEGAALVPVTALLNNKK